MSIQAVNYPNEKGAGTPPNYEVINFSVKNNVSTVRNSNQGVVATYTLYKSGIFKKSFVYRNDNENKAYNIQVSFLSAKLIDDNNLPIIKLKHAGIAFTTTTWNITFLIKNVVTYSSIKLIKKTFEFIPKYKLIFKKGDNTIIEYVFTLSSILCSSWNLSCCNQNILKYNHHLFKKNTLIQYHKIDDEQFKIILLALSFLTIDHEHRKDRSQGDG